MKSIKFLAALIALVLSFSTCTENDPSMTPEPEKPKGEPTPIGIPVGTPNSKIIGASGGSIVSLDGMMGLEIPAGALSADTEISIQPITNFAPNGNGNAYHLSPEGIKFTKPIKMIFKYEQEISATMPALTGIAFQDTDQIWYRAGKLIWDVTNKTVSAETTHFSSWGTFDNLRIVEKSRNALKHDADGTLRGYELKLNESAEFMLVVLGNTYHEVLDQLSPLVPEVESREDLGIIIKSWSVNGEVNGKPTGKYGTITVNGEDSVCTYKAPASTPGTSKNPVQLSVDLRNLKYKDPRTGQVFNDLTVNTRIKITGEFHFNLEIQYEHPIISGGWGDFTMSDLARLKIHVDADHKVTVSDTINTPANITQGLSNFICTYKWVPLEKPNGLTITGGTGEIISYAVNSQAPSDYLHIVVSGNYQNPKWQAKCPNADPIYQGGEYQPDMPFGSFVFLLKDSAQVFEQSSYYFIKLTPE